MIDLKGKVALITGSSQGIGLEIARLFAQLNCKLIVNSRNSQKIKRVAEELTENFKRDKNDILGISADVSKNEDVASLYQKTIDNFDKIDILINNAGITRDNLLLRMKEKDWDEVINSNLKSAFLTSKYFIKSMLKLGKGRIINISSVVGEIGNAGQSNYAASKAGLIGFSKSLARELASKKITVNVVAPGYIETDMTNNLSDFNKEKIMNIIPLKEFGKTKDIAYVLAFLASDFSNYITGQVISINGGMLM